jgi:SAM-dependent methyltransferase
MERPSDVVRLLRCPTCRAKYSARGRGLRCDGAKRHTVTFKDGIWIFARPNVGKYKPGYASRYAALWTYGYATLNSGRDEGVYRTVASLIAEELMDQRNEQPVIVDGGCGVGRVTGDAARLSPRGSVLAFDASPAMLSFARQIVHGRKPIKVTLPSDGFPSLAIPPYGLAHPIFARADVENLPLANGTADIVLSVNIVDRLPHGPEIALRECHRVLRPGGVMIFTDPFNWTEPWLWHRYPDARAVLSLIERTGFVVETWFDDLHYREVLDARASFDEFRTLIVKARKRGR